MAARILAVFAGLAMIVAAAVPAGAHGALQSPVSRSVNCDPQRASARSAACRAAAQLSGSALAQWDELRVPDVGGRDRQVISDGKLCSAGIARFRGLDLARADWPTTRLTAAARHTFGYRVSIPHRGSFRMYVTRDGYRPTRALTWSALESKPFLEVKDPPRRGDAYVFAGRLPQGKAGRHVIYTIWQTSDTPDTYYSCSDVDFGGGTTGGGKAAGGAGTKSAKGGGGLDTPQNTSAGAVPSAPAQRPERTAEPGRKVAGMRPGTLAAAGGGAGVLLVITIVATVVLVRRRVQIRREH